MRDFSVSPRLRTAAEIAFPDSRAPLTPIAISALLARLISSTERLVSATRNVTFLERRDLGEDVVRAGVVVESGGSGRALLFDVDGTPRKQAARSTV